MCLKILATPYNIRKQHHSGRTIMFKYIFPSLFFASAIVSNAFASSGDNHWRYSGSDGPENWGLLSHDYKLCSAGRNQSPIDIKSSAQSGLFKLHFN